MASFENTVIIRRPVEDVFAFLADFENVPAWNSAIVETRKVSPGPVGVGTTYRQTRSVPRRSEEAFEVTVFEPASRLEVQGELGPFRARVRYALEPAGSGTRLTNAVDLGSSGLLTPGGAAGDLPRQECGGGQPRHAQAAPGTGWPTWCRMTRRSVGAQRTGWLRRSPASQAMPSTSRPPITRSTRTPPSTSS